MAGLYQPSVIEHVLSTSTRAAIDGRPCIVPHVLIVDIINSVVKPVFGNTFGTKPQMYLPLARNPHHHGALYCCRKRSACSAVEYGSIAGSNHRCTQDVGVGPGAGIMVIEVLKYIIVDIVAPLTDTLIGVAYDAVPHVVEAREGTPGERSRI